MIRVDYIFVALISESSVQLCKVKNKWFLIQKQDFLMNLLIYLYLPKVLKQQPWSLKESFKMLVDKYKSYIKLIIFLKS